MDGESGDESVEKMKSEERKGKKRVHFEDDDEEATASSGEGNTSIDGQRQAKRMRRSADGSSMSHTSASPRRCAATTDNDAHDNFPTPAESQERESGGDTPTTIPSPPPAKVIPTLMVDGLLTPDGSDADEESDLGDGNSGSDDGSDDLPDLPPAPPGFAYILRPPGFPRRERNFHGAEEMAYAERHPYLDDEHYMLIRPW
ncbi:hypothetical protein BD410DRAFT_140348 [Rickenella mellea]|uniref:Uncharacterized protein n=1 Tax=Rickenella mellea TaxID=50990 RepID=A0A4Y7PJK2_9AGAM|nr:hypothetical protein BD410DRAFT_140348 [Rickenella mellea]